ncbi:type II toxin-antitoxin system PemK/MazF family toxin [Sphaerotilus sp.]|jgi:mRNA interferase MazF|uniref:type II toxin-antitoxin system PemK/MazF family toxin n=1 Tax=Sphaerotilus sp. TaxID=2093942 RepID=UPI00286E9948|nr:type II toxin-antitoxin system PemK/MazF family toxin [Sphaerotilus sp.]
MNRPIERGEVYWAAFDPVQGSEIAKTRPAVIVSDSRFNAVRRTVVVVPLTTTPSPPQWPLLVELPTFNTRTRARTEQIRAVDKSRLRGHIGRLDTQAQETLDAALAVVLGLRR